MQSDGQLETGMRQMFMAEAQRVIEHAIINGSGTLEPVGFLNNDGATNFPVDDVVNTLTYSQLCGLVANTMEHGKIDENGTVRDGVWVVSPGVLEAMKTKLKLPGGLERILEQQGARYTIDGYPVIPSNAVPNQVVNLDPPVPNDDVVKLAFLDAGEVHIGFWGGVRVSVDMFSNPLAPVFSFYFYYDVALVHPPTVSVMNFRGK